MFLLSPLAQVPATEPVAAGLSLFDLLLKGGFVMAPILLLSLAAFYFFVERLLYLRTAGKTDQAFLRNIEHHVQQGRVQEAMALCQVAGTPVARLLEKGLSRIGSSTRDIESAIENTAHVEVYGMEKNMGYLSVIAAIAPMMGLLGTVTGMIKAFYHISLADNISIGIIAGGIYEKMITSAAGLVVGMLAYVFYTLLHAQVEKTVNKLEVVSIHFMDLLFKVPQYELQEN
ncbi:MotA/TolQ/ExbB proton channel family protein [Rufibacter psychrotolerans]|uniref:MotA/TolQ/ExbB proton channel family protein n=1 Tax=Rufibacter psychrotolerans TaxID=2812556 RepID=UPI0019671CCD|nr:MotA/TolQ/ExbB proton channel family protein [Rufibacter sp. SYSU D00308]